MAKSFFSKLIKKDGQLVCTNETQKKIYQMYVDSIPEGTIVEYYIDIQSDSGSLAQLAKIHAMIRSLANHTGYTFEEMKIYTKEEAGMCYTSSDRLICKSFGDCSKEELAMVITTLEEIGKKVNFQV